MAGIPLNGNIQALASAESAASVAGSDVEPSEAQALRRRPGSRRWPRRIGEFAQRLAAL